MNSDELWPHQQILWHKSIHNPLQSLSGTFPVPQERPTFSVILTFFWHSNCNFPKYRWSIQKIITTGVHGNLINNFGYKVHPYKQNFDLWLFPWEQFFRVLAFTGLSHGLPPNFRIPNVLDDTIHCFHPKYVNKTAGNNFFLGSGAIWTSKGGTFMWDGYALFF